MKETKIIIYNVFGHRNRGDAMLLETLINFIKNNNNSSIIYGIAFDTQVQKNWMPNINWYERIGNRSSPDFFGRLKQVVYLLSIILIICIPFGTVFRFALPSSQRKGVEALMGADLAISCPGGYLEDSSAAYILAALQIKMASRLTKNNILAPQSIGPVKSRFGKIILRWALSDVQEIYVREYYSYNFITKDIKCRNINIFHSGDLAFWFKNEIISNSDEIFNNIFAEKHKPIIGITVVNWKFPNKYNKNYLKNKYVESIISVIKFANSLGFQCIIFNQVESDLIIANEIKSICPSVIVDSRHHASHELYELIGKCDFFVGTRFHSCIFAMLNGTPTISISYVYKTNGVMKDLGLEDFVIEIENITPKKIIDKLEYLLSNKVIISKLINDSVYSYKLNNENFFFRIGSKLDF